MRVRWFGVRLVFLLFVTTVCPVSLIAAAAPLKATFTYGGLNERSGVLFVARDAGIFQKHGLDATIVNVRNAQVGMSALAGGGDSVPRRVRYGYVYRSHGGRSRSRFYRGVDQ